MRGVKFTKLESGEKYQRLLNKEMGTRGIKAGHVILKPGENIGEHSTGEREEVVIVLKGRGQAKITKGNTLKLCRKAVLYVSPDTRHDIKNTGPGILEYIYVTADAGVKIYFD